MNNLKSVVKHEWFSLLWLSNRIIWLLWVLRQCLTFADYPASALPSRGAKQTALLFPPHSLFVSVLLDCDDIALHASEAVCILVETLLLLLFILFFFLLQQKTLPRKKQYPKTNFEIIQRAAQVVIIALNWCIWFVPLPRAFLQATNKIFSKYLSSINAATYSNIHDFGTTEPRITTIILWIFSQKFIIFKWSQKTQEWSPKICVWLVWPDEYSQSLTWSDNFNNQGRVTADTVVFHKIVKQKSCQFQLEEKHWQKVFLLFCYVPVCYFLGVSNYRVTCD